jgi:hypothetical protein
MTIDAGAAVPIAGSLVAAIAALIGCVKWIFRRGEASGRAQMAHRAERKAQAQAEASLRAMAERMAELESELECMRTHRRRA